MAADSTSRGTNPVVWLVGLLTVGAAALFGLKLPDQLHLPNPSAEPASKKSEQKPGGANDTGASEPLRVLRDYLQVAADEAAESSTFNLKFNDSSFALSLDGKKTSRKPPQLEPADLLREPAEYEFLIATVPDPIETKLPHEFDAVLDGIQRAFEARGFVLRASRMPWPHDRTGESPAIDRNSVPRHREYPGVLLFRKSRDPEHRSDPPAFALVCLVGESPISGIHKGVTGGARTRSPENTAFARPG